jgi:hypothetical protein
MFNQVGAKGNAKASEGDGWYILEAYRVMGEAVVGKEDKCSRCEDKLEYR